MTLPNPRGGKREGAGRKPSPDPHKRYNVYLSDTDYALLKAINKNISAAIRKLLKDSKP